MTNLLSRRPSDRPPQREDVTAGAAMSVIAHAMLLAALVWGVHWRSQSTPEGATAELWAAVPQAAAPPPTAAPQPEPTPAPTPPAPVPAPVPAPPPPPPVAAPKPPDIVTEKLEDKKRQREQELKEQQEKAKLEQQKADQAKADADKQKAVQQQKLDAQKLAKLHDENVRRMMGQMDAPPDATGTAARSAGPSATYLGRVIARLKPNLTLIDSMTGNPRVEVDIRCAPDGTIISRKVTKSSGTPEWDDAVLRAIDKTGTLPRDTDGRTPSLIQIAWNLQDAK